MKVVRFTFCILLAAIVWGTGCSTPKPTPDPLVGWNFCFSQDPDKLDKAIRDDYQDYIQKLPSKEKKYVGVVNIFEDGTGQHAVKIEINLNGTEWSHVLTYDKNDKRIKVIKYVSGHYRS